MKKILLPLLPNVAFATFIYHLKLTMVTTVTMLFIFSAKAQKKVTPVTQSVLTGISLPAGSKQDSRMLMVASGKALLEMETKKSNTTISKTEILYLPAAAAGADAVSIVQQLAALGWSITPVAGDEKYAWMQKENRYMLIYFSPEKKDNNLYFGEVAHAPAPAANGNNNTGYQNANNQPTAQQPDLQQNPQQQSAPQQNAQQPNDPQQPGQNTQPINMIPANDPQQATQNIPNAPARQDGFAFTTTNFDDGWTSTVQEDWVEVIKGNIKVLLHYPKEGTIFPADPAPLINAAWDILVAPRYSTLNNYKTTYISTYDRPYLGFGNATDKATGKELFVLLFRQGDSGWLEFITPDKNDFVQYFKFDPYAIQWDSETNLLKPLAEMVTYNRFGVANSDFTGRWTSDFTGIQQLYSVYTGQYAGMNINQSNEEFDFKGGNSYNWKLLVINGMVGNTKFNQVKSSGTFSVPNNWQIQFSVIEEKPQTCNAHWSCIKGARVLNLLDAQYPGSGIYKKYGLAK